MSNSLVKTLNENLSTRDIYSSSIHKYNDSVWWDGGISLGAFLALYCDAVQNGKAGYLSVEDTALVNGEPYKLKDKIGAKQLDGPESTIEILFNEGTMKHVAIFGV